MSGKQGNVLIVSAITVLSGAVALLVYGVLHSTGDLEQPGVRVGGALAGFVIVFGLLARFHRSLLRLDSLTEMGRERQIINDLRARNTALTTELLKRLVVPDGYVPASIDQHKLVMARPERFVSEGGVLLDVAEPAPLDARDGERCIDLVPARFRVTFEPIDGDVPEPDDFYRHYGNRLRQSPVHELMGLERTFIGLEEAPSPALKVSTRTLQRVRCTVEPGGTVRRTQEPIARADWPEHAEFDPAHITVPAGRTCAEELPACSVVMKRTTTVVCLNVRQRQVFFFTFEDDEADFPESVETLHTCLRSVRFLA